jgi:hypothetical protein
VELSLAKCPGARRVGGSRLWTAATTGAKETTIGVAIEAIEAIEAIDCSSFVSDRFFLEKKTIMSQGAPGVASFFGFDTNPPIDVEAEKV